MIRGEGFSQFVAAWPTRCAGAWCDDVQQGGADTSPCSTSTEEREFSVAAEKMLNEPEVL